MDDERTELKYSRRQILKLCAAAPMLASSIIRLPSIYQAPPHTVEGSEAPLSAENDATFNLVDDYITMNAGEGQHLTIYPFDNDDIQWPTVPYPFYRYVLEAHANSPIPFQWNWANIGSPSRQILAVQFHEPPVGNYNFTYSITDTQGLDGSDEAKIHLKVINPHRIRLPFLNTSYAVGVNIQ